MGFNLTNPQRATLRAHIASVPQLDQWFTDGAWGSFPTYFEQPSEPAVSVYRTNTPIDEIDDAIIWERFVPGPAVDTTLYLNEMLKLQSHQFGLQLIFRNKETLNTANAKVRNALEALLVDLPNTANNNLVQAGWPAVDLLIRRGANRFEALFAAGSAPNLSLGKDKDKSFIEGVPPYALFQGL